MIKRQTTQELITASLLDLAAGSKPFRSITIQDITDNCGISRRTFYNTFNDKYDIVLQLYSNTLTSDHQRVPANSDYYSILYESCKKLKHDNQYWKKFISDDVCREYFQNFICQLFIGTKQEMDVYEKTLLRFYSIGFSQSLIDWILHGCQQDASFMASILVNTVPGEIKHMFSGDLVIPATAAS